MKPRVGVYLSEGMAARLAEAAKSPRATKSALVEAALDRYFGSDDAIDDTAAVARHFARLSRQLEELDRNLRIANETAALHARFHLAVPPPMPAGELGAACALGAERFEEFAAQVGRRIDLGVPSFGRRRVDAATLGLRAVEAALFPDSATRRGIEESEGAVPSRRSVPTWLTGSERGCEEPCRKQVADPARLPAIRLRLLLVLRLPIPSYLQWAVVAAVGAATVLSFAILAEYFPKELAGRANGALNLFHIAAAFVVQYATGVVLQHWTPQAGHYPEIAYQTAFALNLAIQVAA